MDIGPNLLHILQLTLIGTVCVLLAIFSKIDTTALLTAFIGVSGAISGVHLANTYALMSSRMQIAGQPRQGRPAVIMPSAVVPEVKEENPLPHA